MGYVQTERTMEAKLGLKNLMIFIELDGLSKNFVAFRICMWLCKTRKLAFSMKMEDNCEKQVYNHWKCKCD